MLFSILYGHINMPLAGKELMKQFARSQARTIFCFTNCHGACDCFDSCNRKWHRPGNKANKSGLRATKLSSALDLSKLPSLNKNRRDITTNTEKTFNPNPKKQLGVQSMISDRYL